MFVYSPPFGKASQACADVVIAGAGVIGLSLALELSDRGASVLVIERGRAGQQASSAAAGMLAAEDPHNPPELLALGRYSVALYPRFLARIEALSGREVPFQTSVTWQHSAGAIQRLDEHSIDPRQLSSSLIQAVSSAGIRIEEGRETVEKEGRTLVQTTGAWFWERAPSLVRPRKGQMLRVALPMPLTEVHRSSDVYVVPRTAGPQAGTALIGATVEDAGFDIKTQAEDLRSLRAQGAKLFPGVGDERAAPMVEAWAGLRPATWDELPLLGSWDEGEFVATGHYRNGILLAPATAKVMADLIEGKDPLVEVEAFSPRRAMHSAKAADIRSGGHDNGGTQVR